MKPRTAKELLKQIADARRTPPPKMLTIYDLARLAKQRRRDGA